MELKFILEAILFASDKPLSTRELRNICASAAENSEDPAVKEFKKPKDDCVVATLEELAKEHADGGRSYRLVCVAGSWQFVSEPDYAPWLRPFVGTRSRVSKLSQPALETLAIIAYRQPLTRAEMEQIRGVSVDGVLHTLVERDLVEQRGRAEVVGRPMTFGTTLQFLEYFGLRNLEELPAADELRRIVVDKPESLLTAEPGLATVPPEQLASDDNAPPSAADSPQSPEENETEPAFSARIPSEEEAR